MKVIITLSKAEVQGIKEYLKEADGMEYVTNDHVAEFVEGHAKGILYAPQEAVSHYINKYVKPPKY